ncbi:MAG: 30S ribosomal protein S2 [Candidatus Fraserbacteria bacterium RBG_16_55_9]|uniref:Small ribosomal subunit protein uS2 n=1 Tax=Fraserbacteria sp. (strain RBG_16_55_9) TaxID=1817864 RepID=A0A1F5UWS4_FRAXR|nr:MAG: 30S ribosomal protein S2 [Candidatus Fraserbacteria bacterium RBG_16_55_9]
MEKGGSSVGLLTIKELLETGVHFGHRVRKWNPKMKDYIYTERKGIHIIDLEKTIRFFAEAYFFIRDSIAQGKEILFVGTKRQVQQTIEEEAQRCGAHYVNQRWLGGLLTNFQVIKGRIDRMKELEEHERVGDFEKLPNKEAIRLRKELLKLQRNLQGLRNMTRVPHIVFVVDTQVEVNAIHEARLLKIPVVSIVDTNCDPDPIDYPIPGNDDAIKATKLIISRIADAVIEGREGRTPEIPVTPVAQVAESAREELNVQEIAAEPKEGLPEEALKVAAEPAAPRKAKAAPKRKAKAAKVSTDGNAEAPLLEEGKDGSE